MSTLFKPIIPAEIFWQDDTPHSEQFADRYHAQNQGVAEAEYVFIRGNNLVERWGEDCNFTIAETGFGIGLNFLLTWALWLQHAPQTAHLYFISCEKHPLKLADLTQALSRYPQLTSQTTELIAKYPILTPGYHWLTFERVTLLLMLGDVQDCYQGLLQCGVAPLENSLRSFSVDAWYLDGFAPAKNSEMWHADMFKTIALLSHDKTTLSTFSAARMVKEGLHNAGFTSTIHKGFGNKRHMLTASYQPHDKLSVYKKTAWHASNRFKSKTKHAIVLGSGLAGACTAYQLVQLGWTVQVIESKEQSALGASGIQKGILYPNISAYKAPLTELMLMGFLYSTQWYKNHFKTVSLGELNGIMQFFNEIKDHRRVQGLKHWLKYYPELGQFADSANSKLFIPYAGWIEIPKLCNYLLSTTGIETRYNSLIQELDYRDGQWSINDAQAEVLILANGVQVNQFNQTHYIPIKPIRGQATFVRQNAMTTDIKIPLCTEGHLLPAGKNGLHLIGATYDLYVNHDECNLRDDERNIASVSSISKFESSDIAGHWAGVRAAAPDNLPVVGKVANSDEFKKVFAHLLLDKNYWIAQQAPVYPGLYVCSGFASRGLTTIPLCTLWLASLIEGVPSPLPRHIIQAISPARFLVKNK